MPIKNVTKYFMTADHLIARYEWLRDPFQTIPDGTLVKAEQKTKSFIVLLYLHDITIFII